MTLARSEFCQRVFYGVIELLAFVLVWILVSWYAQSKQDIIRFDAEPGYSIKAISSEYIEVQWKDAALVSDCPGFVQPAIVGENATEILAPYPFIVEHTKKTFTRRYGFTHPLPSGDYVLRITLRSQCNPLFAGLQVLRVPFQVGQ